MQQSCCRVSRHDPFLQRKDIECTEKIKSVGHWPELGRAAVRDSKGGKLVEIEGTGHVSHMEKPREFNAALKVFLSERYQVPAARFLAG